MRIISAIALLLLCSGCMHHSVPGRLNYIVDGNACHASMRLVNCDSASPPNCEHRIVSYDKNCEQLVANQAAHQATK